MASDNGENHELPNAKPKRPKFPLGNKLAKGNPFAQSTERFRKMIHQCVTRDDFIALIQTLVTLGKGGDVAAIKVILDRLCGPVGTAVEMRQGGMVIGVIELPSREFDDEPTLTHAPVIEGHIVNGNGKHNGNGNGNGNGKHE